jgi:5-methylcytosine-specific restriction endonuclease McrA
MAVPDRIRRQVCERAGFRCEYCRMRQQWELFPTYHIEHVIAKQHRGTDDLENLALACNHCNLLKGPNLSSRDPDGDSLVPLFHPRTMSWDDHFRLEGARIQGTTDIGRTTVFLLEMNADHQVDLREVNLWDW